MSEWRRIRMLKVKLSVIFSLTVILLILPFGEITRQATYGQDVYDVLRLKYREKLTGYDPGTPYDLSDPHIQSYIERLDDAAGNYWRSLNPTTHAWDDLEGPSAEDSAALLSLFERLETMTKAWATCGSEYYQNAQFLNDVIAGLDWFYENRYNEHTSPYDNWWQWEIGIPLHLNDTLILLYDVLTSEQIDNYMRAIDHFTPNVDMTAANRVWQCKVVTLRGIIGKQPERIQTGLDGLSNVFSYVTSGEGFYRDGSFIQHGCCYPYAGGYGAALLYHISDLLWIISGSSWDNASSERDNVYEWVYRTYDPALFKGTVLESVRGREITRPFTGSLLESPVGRTRIVEGLLILTDFADGPHISNISSILKHHLENGDREILFRHLSIWYIQRAQSMLDDPTIPSAPPLIGNYQFYNQDRVVHRRPGGVLNLSKGWLYDIAMHSDRIRDYEWLNGENPRGWYTADGMTYLYMHPEDYNFIFWSTVDPHRLPGITVDRDPSRPDGAACCALMPNSWVGGAALEGTYGVAGMDFLQQDYSNMDLRARKSWFMFDDEIVALGAGISSTSGRQIETVVENRSLNSQGDDDLVVDGTVQPSTPGWTEQPTSVNWFHLADTGGYVFPGSADLNFLREERVGKNEDINTAFYVPGNDEFDTTEKSTFWAWVREHDTHYTWTGSALEIVTQQGTLAGVANSTRNLLLTETPPEDFRIATRLTFAPSEVGQEAGLIIYLNDDNYVYISSSYDDNGYSLKTVSESYGVTSTHSTDNAFGSTVYLRIDKSGDQYSMYASGDGETWGEPIHTYVNELAGDADRGWNLDLKMGLFAQNGGATVPEVVAEFAYFHFEHTRNYLTVWLAHGVDPSDAFYSYVVLPGKAAHEVSEYSAHPDVVILANNSSVQAVKETKLGITGANFWSDTGGRVSYLTAHSKAAVVMREHSDGTTTVAVADPTHTQSTVAVELARTATSVLSQDPTVTVLQLSPTVRLEVNVAETPGGTHTITLKLLPLDFHIILPIILDAYQFDRLTYDPADDFEPALSPDGETVVFISDRTGQSDIFSIPLMGGQPTYFTQTPAAREDTPVFSPDGSAIAFASDRTGDWDIYLMDTNGANVRTALGGCAGTDEVHPAFTSDGLTLAFSSNRADGNWDIYTASIDASEWTRLTTDPAADRFPNLSADSKTIAFRSERDGNSEVYLMEADGSNLRRVTDNPAFDGYPSIIPDGSGVVFVSNRSGKWNTYVTNMAGQGLTALEQREDWQMDTPRLSSDGRLLLYAGAPTGGDFDIYKREFASPLMLIGQRGADSLGEHCDWEAGVLAYGWIHAWQATQDDQYRHWAQQWVDACIPIKTEITHVNDGLLGYAALVAYETSGRSEYLAFAQRVADYLMNTAPRTTDGTLTHDSNRVWVDTLLGTVPFLLTMSQVSDSDVYADEAVSQVIKHADHLQSPASGLYYHAWDETGNNPAGQVHWGRGNGWALLADVEVLSAITTTHPLRSIVLDIMQKQAAGLRPLQDADGLWHTVLTLSDSYLETSASALLGYAFKRGIQEGWLDQDAYAPVVQAAMLGVWRQVLADGIVTSVSAPTWPMLTEEEYNDRPHDSLQLYGQGVALLLGSQ